MIKLILVALFWVLWGVSENRVWKEHGENWILGHFKTYHAVMGAFDVAIASLGADSVWQFLFLLVWAPLALDVVWWLIRYWDFQVDPVKATESYGEPNAWHSRDDWDNWLGLPLVLGCYWWWWVCLGILVVLGVLML
jgi:hypothetical protein